MAKNDNLKDYLKDLYEGIKTKNPNASPNPQKFRQEIELIKTPSEEKTATPVEGIQEITPSEGKLLSKVVVEAIDSNYVGSGVNRQGAVTFIPTTTDLTIAADTYLTGDVTIKGDPNLLAENIKKGVVLYEGTSTPIVGSLEPSAGEDMLQQRVNATNSCYHLFYYYLGDNVDYIANLDTSKVTDMSYMFEYCSNITAIPLLDTSNVKTMERMFYKCKNLTTIPLLDTSNVTDMGSMFSNCSNLTTIPLLDTSNVTDTTSMFSTCKNLTTIPLLDTNNVTNMCYMFIDCSNLTTIPLLDTSNVTDMNNMFSGCFNLTTIPLLDTSNVTDMSGMFRSCRILTSIPALDTSNVTNMRNMFYYCSSLKSILMTGMSVNFDISASTKFEQSDLVTILNNLATVTSTKTLTMGRTNLAKLTDADKAIATNKGWTLA